MSLQNHAITEAALTAYLDGEADVPLTAQITAALETDTTLAARLDALRIDQDALQQAFALDTLAPPNYQPPPANMNQTPRWLMPTAIAASFVAGLVIMSAIRPAPTWVDTVASYQALYVTETLSGPAQSAQMLESVLAQAENLLGVDLRSATDLAELDFKRAQILAIGGQPLIQMAYLDADGAPFAFCVTTADQVNSTAEQMMSHGLATDAWVNNGIGYVLVGGQDLNTVSDLSANLRNLL